MRKRNHGSSWQHGSPDPRSLEKILVGCGISLSPEQLRQLWIYHHLLREHNPELNLTRIHSFEAMALKLYADSLLPGRLIELPSPLMDLGTGPGMPGIPLKIANPGVEVLLAEARSKRVAFLGVVLEELGVTGIRVIGKAVNERFEEPVRGVITRAVGTMAETAARVRNCLVRGGKLIFMKGPECDGEIQDMIRHFGKEYVLEHDIHYRIGKTSHRRRLVAFERTGQTMHMLRETAMRRHAVRRIESEHNEVFKDLKRLLTVRGIRKRQNALISGPKQVGETLRDLAGMCLAWVSAGDADPPPPGSPENLQWIQLAPPLFQILDVFGTHRPLLLVGIPEIDAWDAGKGLPEGCTVFVPFQDPENVGAVVRSAVAFGVNQLILLEESAHPYHPKAMRASGGAVLRAKFLEGPSIHGLPAHLPIFALSSEGTDIARFAFPERFGLLPGIEGPGLPPRWKHTAIGIPIQREVESLNAATATAVALYVWSRSLRVLPEPGK